ncbi:MAG: HlyC/CorC family transporter [Xanthomonadaceae bacterium]|nr:HlyC/CorC family transporter [Xanthomonadaceae bacterium]
MTLTAFIVITALILVNALYVAAEFATVGVRHSQVQQKAEEGSALAKRLMPIVSDTAALDRYIAACQIGITISSLVLGAYGQATLARDLTPMFQAFGGMQELAAQSAATVIVLVVLTGLQMVIGELVPKSLALQYPLQTALYTYLPMRWSLAVMKWFIMVLNGSGNLILKALGIRHSRHRHIHSPEEIDLLIAESRELGLLDVDEQQRLHEALFLSRRTARQLMVPRRFVNGVDADVSARELMRLAVESPYSTLPVYTGSDQRPIGMLHTKDIATHFVATGKLPTPREIMRPLVVVLENVTGARLLAVMRERGVRKLIVIDEYGSMRGLVTLDDVLSVLVGGVADEYKSEGPQAEPLPDGRVRLPGIMRLDDAIAATGHAWTSEASTVAGFIITALERIPSTGERFEIEGIDIEIERMDGPAIESVLVTPMAEAASDAEGL